MSLHPSLKVDTAGAQQRSVLTRIERIKDLMKKDLWEDGRRVTGLPKTKIVRIKAHKAKEDEEKETEETASASAGEAPAKKAGDSDKGKK